MWGYLWNYQEVTLYESYSIIHFIIWFKGRYVIHNRDYTLYRNTRYLLMIVLILIIVTCISSISLLSNKQYNVLLPFCTDIIRASVWDNSLFLIMTVSLLYPIKYAAISLKSTTSSFDKYGLLRACV